MTREALHTPVAFLVFNRPDTTAPRRRREHDEMFARQFMKKRRRTLGTRLADAARRVLGGGAGEGR